jgi:glycosyltransferase involved in cell wall biosynthesis
VAVPVDVTTENGFLWELLLEELKEDVPNWNINFKPVRSNNDQGPALYLCLDPAPTEQSVTVLIPHWESIGFLELCLYSLNISNLGNLEILVCDDDSSDDTWKQVQGLCHEFNATAIQVARKDAKKVADVGAVLDFALQFVDTEYVCMLDADTVVISSEFLTKPIQDLQHRYIASVGLDTNLGGSYHPKSNWGFDNPTKLRGLRPPGFHSITNNLFRVMRTQDALAVSTVVGFSRRVSDRKFRDQLGRVLRAVATRSGNKDLQNMTKRLLNSRMLNSKYPAMPPTGDNGVAANGWLDANRMGLKRNIPITSYGVMTSTDGVAFQNISNLLVHVALSTRALSETRREVDDPGAEYIQAVRDIVNRKGPIRDRYQRVTELSKKIKY